MDIFEKVLLGLITIVVLGLLVAIVADSNTKKQEDSEYKACLDSNGVLIQEYGSTIYYCAEVKRIKL